MESEMRIRNPKNIKWGEGGCVQLNRKIKMYTDKMTKKGNGKKLAF